MRSPVRAIAILLAAALAATGASAAPPSAKCHAAKLKASAKRAGERLKCLAKANDTGGDPAECLADADAKFDAAIAKATARGGCVSEESAEALAKALDCALAAAHEALAATELKCASKKLKAVGKGAAALLQCRARAAVQSVLVPSSCVEKAQAKIAAAFERAERPGGCATSGDAEAIGALVALAADRTEDELVGTIASQEEIFDFTGSPQTFTVPACATVLHIEACGAEGATGGGPAGGAGGLGGCATGDLEVLTGQELAVFVGGKANVFNGAGVGGNALGATGGGASDVRADGIDLADRVIVGGGGGGGGGTGCELAHAGGAGGSGGGAAGGNGTDSPTGGGGAGGSAGAGGAAGVGCVGFLGQAGDPAGTGGAGQDCCCLRVPGGGGGGGGFVPGGGGGGGSAGTLVCSGNDKGGGGGGAGGTSSTVGVANGAVVDGVRSGNGRVTIVW
jgi:hypothetical protein